MPSINSQIQLPVIPWLLWTTKTQLKIRQLYTWNYTYFYLWPPPLPVETTLIMNALIILNGSWSQDLILVFSLYLIQVSFLCSAMCYRMQYLIISHFSFHAQRVKKFWRRQLCWWISKPNFKYALFLVSMVPSRVSKINQWFGSSIAYEIFLQMCILKTQIDSSWKTFSSTISLLFTWPTTAKLAIFF